MAGDGRRSAAEAFRADPLDGAPEDIARSLDAWWIGGEARVRLVARDELRRRTLARWATSLRARGAADVAIWPIGRRWSTATEREALLELHGELGACQPGWGPTQRLASLADLRNELANRLLWPGDRTRPLLLLVDAPDEAVGWTPERMLEHGALGAGVRVLVGAADPAPSDEATIAAEPAPTPGAEVGALAANAAARSLACALGPIAADELARVSSATGPDLAALRANSGCQALADGSLVFRDVAVRRRIEDEMGAPARSTAHSAFAAHGATVLRGWSAGSQASRYVARYQSLHLELAGADLDAWAPLVTAAWQAFVHAGRAGPLAFVADVARVRACAAHALAHSPSAAAAVLLVRCVIVESALRWPNDEPDDAAARIRALVAMAAAASSDKARTRVVAMASTLAPRGDVGALVALATAVGGAQGTELARAALATARSAPAPARDLVALAALLPRPEAEEAVALAMGAAEADVHEAAIAMRDLPEALAPLARTVAAGLREPARRALRAVLVARLGESQRGAAADEVIADAIAVLEAGRQDRELYDDLAAVAEHASIEGARRVLAARDRLDAAARDRVVERFAARVAALGHQDELAAESRPRRPAPGTHLGRVTSGADAARLRYVERHMAELAQAHGHSALLEFIRTLGPRHRVVALAKAASVLSGAYARDAAQEAAQLVREDPEAPVPVLFALAATAGALTPRDAGLILARCGDSLAAAADATTLLSSAERYDLAHVAPLLRAFGDVAVIGAAAEVMAAAEDIRAARTD